MSHQTSHIDEKVDLEHASQHAPSLKGETSRSGYNADGVDRHLAIEKPEILQGLTDEETAELDKRTTKKLDILLMPTLVILYILNYLDRQNIASAKIAKIDVELGLSPVQYQTAVAILFAGYVALQVPSNMIVSKIKWPGIYICGMCVAWGLVSACTGLVQSYAGLVICRTILGFTEAAFFPGAVFLLSLFYEKKQMAFRTAILYSGSQIGNAFGGLFALAILTLEGAHGLSGWRWLFIVEGVMTIGLGFIFMLWMPNTPTNIKWLNEQEKAQLKYRLEVDRSSKDATDEVGVGRAFWLAVTDVKTWLLCLVLQMNYIAASVTNFFPIVVAGLGFNRTTTLAITAPPYLLCCVVIMINGWHSDKKQERALHIICPFFVTIAANVIAVSTTNVAARYTAMMLLPGSFYSASIVVLSWISSSCTGPAVKRAIVYALINSICNTPNIWTSYLYSNPPGYVLAFSVDLAASVGVVLAAALTWWYLRNQNRKIERGEPLGINGPTQVQIEAGFRFQL